MDKSFIVDGHHDLLMIVEKLRLLEEKKVIENRFLERYKKGGFNLIISSIFIDDIYIPEMALRKSLDQIASLYQEIRESSGKIELCKSFRDIEELRQKDSLGIMLSLEGADPIGNDIELLEIFYELGVRFLGITWSRRNYAADGCYFHPQIEGKKGGLTPFGVKLIQKAQNLGIILDVSHLNDEAFEDVFHFSKGPLIASHSNCRSLVNSPRNLTDRQIKMISERNGIIGINAASVFVSEDQQKAGAQSLTDHIEHIISIAGIDTPALGFDFSSDIYYNFGNGLSSLFSGRIKDSIQGHENLFLLTEELVKRGFSEKEIRKVYGENHLRILRAVLI